MITLPKRTFRTLLALVIWLSGIVAIPSFAGETKPVTHSFMAFGGETRKLDDSGHVLWSYPASTRDGYVLTNGHVLMALSKSDAHPHGAIVEVGWSETTGFTNAFSWEGTQDEVNTVQPLPDGGMVTTEAGDRPRILELNRAGQIVAEVILRCQTTNHHLQTRMTRKLANGNYLVPQLLDRVVREYSPQGKIVWEYKTPDEPAESWPFTAIRLPNGNTLINCTHGNHSIEVNAAGHIVWQLTNADLPQPLLKDPCGAQRLPNGNTVITSYGAGDQKVKLLEVNAQKQIVWTYEQARAGGIHEFQILDTDGQPIEWPPLK